MNKPITTATPDKTLRNAFSLITNEQKRKNDLVKGINKKQETTVIPIHQSLAFSFFSFFLQIPSLSIKKR